MRALRCLGCAWLLLTGAAIDARAQLDTATVIGTVSDAQGAVLPGATIVVRNVETGFVLSAVGDAEGRYRIAAVPPGDYEITAELQGFSRSIRRGVRLSLGSEAVINMSLQLAGVAEAVTVTADTPVVQTTTAAVEASINREQIDMLPLISREYTSLLRLVAGAQSSNGVSFTGSRGRSNQWSIDGVDNSEDISGYSRQSPALESVKEIQVVVNGFKAEYGSASGGIVNVVTSATALLTALAKAETDGQLAERLMYYTKPKLLMIDELGYLPFERRSAHLFFQLVARRYERGSLLITTNQLVTQWGAVFGDEVLAAAILDRLLHHSHTLMIQGDSYRLKQKKKAGLLGRTPPART